MSATRTALALAASLPLLLQACVNAPASPATVPVQATATVPVETSAAPGATAGSDTVPKLTLNLPQPAENCACNADKPADYTFLDKGLDALLDGEYIDAVQYFQRYQRLESSPRADWEAAIAIAYVSMLPRSPFYDPEAARNSFKELRKQNAKDLKVHDYTRLMRQSLLNFLIQEQHMEDLESTNATLKGDLEKREEALKRLRELTLGQKGSTQ